MSTAEEVMVNPDRVPSQSPEQLLQLATDLFKGLVLTDRHARIPEDLLHIFLVINLGALSDCSTEYKQDIGMIYEYLDRAGPMAVNSYPMFFSLRLLNQADTKTVWDKYAKIKELVEAL